MLQFDALSAQVLGISVDSVYSHQAFADQLGGLTYPLLSDFHPKGEVAQLYGVWRADKGYNRRAIVIIDASGIVQHSEIIPQGVPDVAEVLKRVRELAGEEHPYG